MENTTRLLRRRQVEATTGFRRSTIYERMARGQFPRPIRFPRPIHLGRRSVVRYSVLLSPSAERDLGALDKPVQRRVVARIEALAENPRPAGVAKLQGVANAWRIRVGDYRVLYTIEDGRLVVLVVKIGHRREVYR
jgi:mRNA interferase RelE/StbE